MFDTDVRKPLPIDGWVDEHPGGWVCQARLEWMWRWRCKDTPTFLAPPRLKLNLTLPSHTSRLALRCALQFLDCGGCGYVKKPDWMLGSCALGECAAPLRLPSVLQVTVLSAHSPTGDWHVSFMKPGEGVWVDFELPLGSLCVDFEWRTLS